MLTHAVYHNIVQRDLDHFNIPKTITLFHYINDIILTGTNEQEVARMLEALLKYIHSKVGD